MRRIGQRLNTQCLPPDPARNLTFPQFSRCYTSSTRPPARGCAALERVNVVDDAVLRWGWAWRARGAAGGWNAEGPLRRVTGRAVCGGLRWLRFAVQRAQRFGALAPFVGAVLARLHAAHDAAIVLRVGMLARLKRLADDTVKLHLVRKRRAHSLIP